MANSRFAYVRKFEQHEADRLLPGTWIVVRLDGRHFHRFCKAHGLQKPNDLRALALANRCAEAVMAEFGDIVLGYGQSDEYSFVLRADTKLYGRRSAKIGSSFAALFAASYVFHWPSFMGEMALQYPPSFDGRCVAHPRIEHVRDGATAKRAQSKCMSSSSYSWPDSSL